MGRCQGHVSRGPDRRCPTPLSPIPALPSQRVHTSIVCSPRPTACTSTTPTTRSNADRCGPVKTHQDSLKRQTSARSSVAAGPSHGNDKLSCEVAAQRAARFNLKLTRADGSGEQLQTSYQQQQRGDKLVGKFFAAAEQLSGNGDTMVLGAVVTSVRKFEMQQGPGRPGRDSAAAGGGGTSRVIVGSYGFEQTVALDAAALATMGATTDAMIGGIQQVEFETGKDCARPLTRMWDPEEEQQAESEPIGILSPDGDELLIKKELPRVEGQPVQHRGQHVSLATARDDRERERAAAPSPCPPLTHDDQSYHWQLAFCNTTIRHCQNCTFVTHSAVVV